MKGFLFLCSPFLCHSRLDRESSPRATKTGFPHTLGMTQGDKQAKRGGFSVLAKIIKM